MGGTIATVSPQNWLFLRTYKRFRRRLLEEDTWHFVAFLGAKAFSENRGEVVKPQLSIVSRTPPGGAQELRLLDVSLLRSPKVKAGGLIAMQARPRRQVDALRSPDSRLTAVSTSGESLIRDFAKSYQGMSTGDNPQFRRLYWESPKLSPGWRLQLGSVSPTRVIGGREYTVNFASLESDGAAYGAALRGREAWEKIGVAVRQTAPLYATVYGGECFDIGLHVIIPENPALLGPLWAYCSNDRFYLAAGELDRKRNVTTATIEQVPFEPMMWRGSEFPVAMDAEGRLLLPPCSDATQWVFHGHPAIAEPSGGLQVAVARLLGYRWPPELEPAMGLADEARTWVKRCRELDEFVEGNGIVCLSGLRGEAGASDRLRRLLAASFGADWSGERERDLLAAAAGDGRPAASLDDWLRDNFFEEHCRLFHQRPFIWHIWDGRRDGFHALVNYHRLAGLDGEGRRTLEMLTYSYLGDWIERQKAEQREGRAGADGRLAAALDLQAQLERILTGEPPCDIFVRWKPLNQQAIGWEPDINDGVRVNIRPFLSVSLRTGGRKGAGILRSKPGVDWRKDRGKEPESLRPKEDFPWFWGCPGDGPADRRTDFVGGRAFDGNRWNDLHYTNAAKRAARDRSPGTHRG